MQVQYILSKETGTIKIASNTKIVIRKGSVISSSLNIGDYLESGDFFVDAVGRESGRTLFYAKGKHDFEIVGEDGSVINGRGSSWFDNEASNRRPGLIRLVNCKNVKIKNLVMIDSSCWAIQLSNCENVEIENVNIISKWGACNTGINVDSCKNVNIFNSVFDLGDSCVAVKTTTNSTCENILVEDCIFSTNWSALLIGTETVGDIKNVTFINNLIKRADGCVIKIVPTDGGNVENVLVENIEVKLGTGPVFIANGKRNARYYSSAGSESNSRISDVTLRNIRADVYINESPLYSGCGDCVFISGNETDRLKNVLIEDCYFKMPGGKTSYEEYSVQELADQYPDYYILGETPASGMYVRHVDGVTIRNVKIDLKENDKREKIVFEDVTDCKKQ